MNRGTNKGSQHGQSTKKKHRSTRGGTTTSGSETTGSGSGTGTGTGSGTTTPPQK
jgi:hypothetical protein